LREIEKDIIFYDTSGGGVTISGGEPLMQPRFLKELLQGIKELDLHTIVDTSGYAPWIHFDAIVPYTDTFFYDIKVIDCDIHVTHTGVPNDLILENLEKLMDVHQDIRIRIPLIPDVTDTEKNLHDIGQYLAQFKPLKQVYLIPFNPLAKAKYQRFGYPDKVKDLQVQSPEKLKECTDILSTYNLKVFIEN
ncbi:MAG: radical SAM protein, partial [Methanobacteriota archaeon]